VSWEKNKMSLSCSCGEWDGEGVGWTFYPGFVQFMGTHKHRRVRCCSCKKMVDLGAYCVQFSRFRYPLTEIECKIAGDWDREVELADWFLCEHCGEIFLNLDAVGYCISPDDSMEKLLSEYHQITGFNK
jgi:hypothetical protein